MQALYQFGAKCLAHLPAETAHNFTIKLLRAGLGPKSLTQKYSGNSGHKTVHNKRLAVKLGRLSLPNPIGLAAGFDKNCEAAGPMLAAGFGFVECGTVTPLPQSGNAKPRLFRLREDAAVINRMGFNNHGLEAFSQRLAALGTRSAGTRSQGELSGIIGANLGANKESKDRIGDYVLGLERLWGLCDYFTINISSPNTPGLRSLQEGSAMEDLLARISEKRHALMGDAPSAPIFLKVAPDLDFAQIGHIVETVRLYGLDAIIVSNTTLDRPDNLQSALKNEQGGLSGQPLFEKSTQILREFHSAAQGAIDLIGVGGIASGAQAYAKIRAGAKAVQLYSALAYHGPALVAQINTDLAARLKADGFETVEDAVGK